ETGADLDDAERLGDVVVAAQAQPADAVLDGVPGGEEQHGYVDAAVAQELEDLEAVGTREHHVEDDDVRGTAGDLVEGFAQVAGHVDVESGELQGRDQQAPDTGVVVDDEDAV